MEMTTIADKTGTKLGPGLYQGMEANKYHSLPFASAHRLNTLFNGSPMHVREEIDHPPRPTPDMIFGTAAHTALLQPDLLRETVMVADQCAATTQRGERCSKAGQFFSDAGEWFCSTHNKKLGHPEPSVPTMSSEDLARAQLVAQAVRKNSYASDLLDAAKENIETTIIFEHEESGCLVKMRPDGLALSLGTCIDFKTCASANMESFENAIARYGYHRQSALYRYGCQRHGIKLALDDPFAFILAEKEPPFAVAVRPISEIALRVGMEECHGLLHQFKACQDSGNWPGYSSEPVPCSLPDWYLRRAAQTYGEKILQP